MKRSKKGFTLVELVVVIALLAILAGIAIPVIGYTINRSKASAAASDAKLVEESLKEANIEIITGTSPFFNYNSKISEVLDKSGASRVSTSVDIAGTTYQLMWSTADEQCKYVSTSSAIDVEGKPINSANWTKSVTPTDNFTTVRSFFK